MFSIIPSNSLFIQNQSTEIQSGQIVHILVKLHPTVPDIELNHGITVQLNVGRIHLVEFLLESGSAR